MEDEATDQVECLYVRAEPIDLVQVIKLDAQVSGGGEAKMLIVNGAVRLNGMVETRKRKKVFSGDVIEYRDRVIRVIVRDTED